MKKRSLSILFVASVSHAATYYVSPDGNDSANGTSRGTAKQTIQAAINFPAFFSRIPPRRLII